MKKSPPFPFHNVPDDLNIDQIKRDKITNIIDKNAWLFAEYYSLGNGKGSELMRLIESVIGVEDVL